METYDQAAFEKFCGELVNAGFSPIRNTDRKQWTGPLRSTLKPLTDATRMRVIFYPGWPLRYAHVVVDGLRSEHASHGIICLWAEDDPAQVAGRDINAIWTRLDEWAETAQRGFRIEDRALDACLLYEEVSGHRAELPLGDFLRQGGNGFRTHVHAIARAQKALFIAPGEQPEKETSKSVLRGAFYLRRDIGTPPLSFEDVRQALTRKQLNDLDHGLADRNPTAFLEPSDGYDFIVLAWPRHDREHDAVVIGFDNRGESLKSYAIQATPNDTAARQRRAGPDAPALADKTVLLAGAGSVGGHVAVGLASSGVGTIRIHDSEHLTTANLIRHVCPDTCVGYAKTIGVAVAIDDHAPWTNVEAFEDLPHDPSGLTKQIEGVDLVVDCTGVFSLSAALAHICQEQSTPLITGALFHQGAIARVQRQMDSDTPIAARNGHPDFKALPPEDPADPDHGFLELGCTAPVNNAPPVTVTATAADICHAAVDHLTERQDRTAERILVFRPMSEPFDRTGTHDFGGNTGGPSQ